MLYEKTVYPQNPFLKNYIHSYWILKSRTNKTDPYLLPPDKHFQLILSFNKDTNVTGKAAGESHVRGSFLVGMQSSHVTLRPDGNVEYLAVQFHPYGIRALLPFASKEIKDVFFELRYLKSRLNEFLKPLLNSISSDEERIKYIEQGLLSVIAESDIRPKKYLAAAVKLINSSYGSLSVQEISEQIGITARQLNREFEQFVGITPKYYSRIVRFGRTLEILQNLKNADNLTAAAYGCSYSDQSHMIHECINFIGLPPKEILKLY
jgi:AraC-like DNA-binding protein